MELEIIQVLMLKESAIQKPTKFQGPHWRRSGSTGLRSRLVSMSWAVVRPGSFSTASLSPHRLRRAPLPWSMAVLAGGGGLRLSQGNGGGLRNRCLGGGLDPGREGVSGGKSAQSRGESGDKTSGFRGVCARGHVQDGTDKKRPRGYGARGSREKGETGDMLFYYILLQRLIRAQVLCRTYFLGLRASGRATMETHGLSLIRSPRPRPHLPPLATAGWESHQLTPGCCRDCPAGS